MFDYFQYFFSPSHLFSLQPPAMQPRALLILGIVFGAFVVGGLAFTTIIKSKDVLKAKAFHRLANLGFTMGLIGGVYLFFAWQKVTLLAGRFWLLIWLMVTITWLVFVLKYLLHDVPSQRKTINQRRSFEKYLP